jgi:peptidoglycan/LPS O-acetylase OafA/YrhL
MNKTYRTDIDSLRAIAVISVILFHLGYLPNGYLGVDIFFVISGFLITGIVFNEVAENKFSVWKFYERRIRRIIPLVLFTSLVAFLFGLFFMLPDDLENLSQSIIASNLSANNILMFITSGDYWAVRNDYMLLMHTWSLGIEEQFYLLYPVIFLLLKGRRKKFILPVLLILTILSLFIFFKSNSASQKFYFLQYRFFELSIGGICAICFNKKSTLNKFTPPYILFIMLAVLIFILFFNIIKSNDIKVLTTTLLSAAILVIGAVHFESNHLYKALLSNKLITGIGKISFSLYMWHQIIFAFARYTIINEINSKNAVLLSLLVLVLSIATYFFIEKPFRNKQLLSVKQLLFILGSFFIVIISTSFYVYAIGGIIKDFPELGLTKSASQKKLNFFDRKSNIHIQYNEDVMLMNRPFSNDGKIKVLVTGDSYARDFANILMESSFSKNIELSYNDVGKQGPDEKNLERFAKADYIFFTAREPLGRGNYERLIDAFKADSNKIWIVGTKDFG